MALESQAIKVPELQYVPRTLKFADAPLLCLLHPGTMTGGADSQGPRTREGAGSQHQLLESR